LGSGSTFFRYLVKPKPDPSPTYLMNNSSPQKPEHKV
jgi:hypothetical protein